MTFPLHPSVFAFRIDSLPSVPNGQAVRGERGNGSLLVLVAIG